MQSVPQHVGQDNRFPAAGRQGFIQAFFNIRLRGDIGLQAGSSGIPYGGDVRWGPFRQPPFLLTEYHVHIIIYMLDLPHTNGLASAEPAVICRSLKAKQEPVTERETRGIARIKRRTAIFLSGGSYGRMRQGLPKGIGKVGSSCSQKRLGTAFEINRRRETAGHSR